jgi:hypothetical protein
VTHIDRMQRLVVTLAVLSLAWVGSARADWPGRPKADPPRLHQQGPPPAWIETSTRSAWLAFGSYCWRTLCADMIPPATRTDLPSVAVRRGRLVRIHLAFTPRAASILIMRSGQTWTYRLSPQRVLEWRPGRAGIVLVAAQARPGSAGYLFRLRFLP